MRYRPDHKEHSRAKIVRKSAALAKQEGFDASGVDALAKASGMTSGAVYKHFAGKDELLSAIVKTELANTTALFSSLDAEQVLGAVDAYLSLAHVRHPERGCLLPALASEVARASNETRAVYERALRELTTTLEAIVGDRARASALISLCVGAVMIARGFTSDEARAEVLAAARESARQLIAG